MDDIAQRLLAAEFLELAPMTDRSEPTTAAGHRMLQGIQETSERLDVALNALDYILAIEAEARQPSPEQSRMLDEQGFPQPDSEALRLLRARIDAEPFFPKGDGPSIGNAAAFRDYKRRILAALPPSDPPALDVERLAEAIRRYVAGLPYSESVKGVVVPSIDPTMAQRIAAEYAGLSAQPLAPLGGEAQPAEDK